MTIGGNVQKDKFSRLVNMRDPASILRMASEQTTSEVLELIRSRSYSGRKKWLIFTQKFSSKGWQTLFNSFLLWSI
jgi:hypothetical protein